jgi:hypothetical protein
MQILFRTRLRSQEIKKGPKTNSPKRIYIYRKQKNELYKKTQKHQKRQKTEKAEKKEIKLKNLIE